MTDLETAGFNLPVQILCAVSSLNASAIGNPISSVAQINTCCFCSILCILCELCMRLVNMCKTFALSRNLISELHKTCVLVMFRELFACSLNANAIANPVSSVAQMNACCFGSILCMLC